MTFRFKTILASAALAGAIIAPQARAAEPAPGAALHDAREQAPAALIGTWKVDLAASTYTGPKPQAAIRSFAYTEGGKILVSFTTLTANGALTSGHWAAQVDGTPAIEYHSSAGALAFNVVSLTKANDTTLNLVVSRNGKVSLKATYSLSADGKVLTYSYDGNVIIYRPWNLVN
ncbi:hypothetical protein H7F51_16665 [Novosphingobium flavum]|uniref:DUF1579 domain-containing protein n=1 Tax=Novosphingobium flavum TaxID=1778672 RepID=A0A7X1KMZ1_9SPHN|nr:hypothetical protein [Novosphingobium flavum]MBC2667154.1 hypothetical protein [Novosphingobium flavum]